MEGSSYEGINVVGTKERLLLARVQVAPAARGNDGRRQNHGDKEESKQNVPHTQ